MGNAGLAPSRSSSVSRRPPVPWWGKGDPPHERWPGVSLDFGATWSTLRSRWETHDGRYYYDPKKAERACSFFPLFLRHHMGEFSGRPFQLRPDQDLLIVRPTFGWRRQSDGMRRFRKVFTFAPKGWGKSPLGAGLGLYLARFDGESAAEVYAVAADREQARTVHDNAKVMVENSPDLLDGCEIMKNAISWPHLYSRYIVLSSDASTKHGFRPHGVVFDELHAQKNRDLFEALVKSMVKREQPLLLIITHAGTDDEGICVAPDTKVLTADLRWVRAGEVNVGDVLAGFDEQRAFQKAQQKGVQHRVWRPAPVTQKTIASLPSYELRLSDGTTVVCSADHMWLVQTAGRRTEWRKTKDLTPTDTFCKVLQTWEDDRSWGGGYLAGVLDSEGHLSATERAHMLCGFSQRENELSDLGRRLLAERDVRFGIYETTHGANSSRIFQTMITRKRDVLRILGSLRPPRLLRRFAEIGWEHLRFKAYERPVLMSKTFIGDREVVGLKTTTHTFVAEGLASHNCYEEYDLAKRILHQEAEIDSTLPVIFEMSPTDDWTDPMVWKRINPGHGTTVKHDAIMEECQQALAEPRKRNDFLRYHGNRWTNQATAWIPIEWWDACEGPLEDAALLDLDCAAGLDLSQKWDLACFCVAFRKYIEVEQKVEVKAEDTTGAIITKPISLNYELFVRPFFWIPENTMRQHQRMDGVPYSQWVEDGLIIVTEGDVIDYTRIYEDITTKIVPRFPRLKQASFAYDPAFATDLATKLKDVAGLKVVEVLQNYKMLSEPSQIVEALIKGKRVHQDGHRVLRWNWQNVAIKTDDAGRIRPIKPRSPSKRIDGAVAMIMADKALSLQGEPARFQFFFAGRGAKT